MTRLALSREIVMDRAGHRCEFVEGTRCTNRATHAHHVKTRGRGGSDEPDNLLALCTEHHGWVHANPSEATDLGYLKASWA